MRQKCCQPKTLTLDPKTGVGSVQDLLVEKKLRPRTRKKTISPNRLRKVKVLTLRCPKPAPKKQIRPKECLVLFPSKMDHQTNRPEKSKC